MSTNKRLDKMIGQLVKNNCDVEIKYTLQGTE